MARFKVKLSHSIRQMFIVQNVASSKRKIQTLSTATNVSEFEMTQYIDKSIFIETRFFRMFLSLKFNFDKGGLK